MQIGEQDLPLAQHGAFRRQRLLHLDDHFGFGEHLGGGSHDGRAGLLVMRIGHADCRTRPAFDDDPMAMLDEFANVAGNQPDPVFVNLRFLRDANQHVSLGRNALLLSDRCNCISSNR